MKKVSDKEERKKADIEHFKKPTGKGLASVLSYATGITAAKPSDHAKAISTIIQEALKGNAWAGFFAALKSYKDNGRIKSDYFDTKQAREGIRLIGQANDDPYSIDEDILEAMKKIFVVMASEKKSDRGDTLPIALLDIAKGLGKEELLILSAAYKIDKKRTKAVRVGVFQSREWLESIASEIGWDVVELVEIHEESLMKKKLITPRIYADGSGASEEPHYRLSNLGYKLCEFINDYKP